MRLFVIRTLPLMLATLWLLGGCAAVAENPEASVARTTCAQVYADPALNPIRAHIPFGDDQATMATMVQLSDQGKPNAAERAAVQQLDIANRRCWDSWDRVGTSPYIQQARTSVSAAVAELYSGASTYGEYNRKRSNAIAEMNARLREDEARARAEAYRNRPMFCDAWGSGPFATLHCF